MNLKDKVEAMRVVVGSRSCKHPYSMQDVARTLYAYIGELESKLAAPKPAPKPTPKPTPKPAPAKKAPAKKAPVKKAPAKKKS